MQRNVLTPRWARSRLPSACLLLLFAVACVVSALEKTAVPEEAAVYAKVILPGKDPARKRPAAGEELLVEPWIVEELNKRGQPECRAVSGWVRLAENHEKRPAGIWNGVLDGKSFGCPVSGRFTNRKSDGKIEVDVYGFSPGGVEVEGTTITPGEGSRVVATVDDGLAFIALRLGPPEVLEK